MSKVIKGGQHADERGQLIYNNDFDASAVKRIYCIENSSTVNARAWQGHKIESRWFAVANGSFEIKLIKVDNWENPTVDLPVEKYQLNDQALDVLYVPPGFLTSIRSLVDHSKLIVMADYLLGEVNDTYKFPNDYFNDNKSNTDNLNDDLNT